jgi:transposase InsO family protein
MHASGSMTPDVAPGSPWPGGFAESFHSRLRDEFPVREEFEGVPQAQALAALWKEDYKTRRPLRSSAI